MAWSQVSKGAPKNRVIALWTVLSPLLIFTPSGGGFYPSFCSLRIAVATNGWVSKWVGGMVHLMGLPFSIWGYGRAPFQMGIWTGHFPEFFADFNTPRFFHL